MNIVKCRFLKDGEPHGREYSYLAKDNFSVGDLVKTDTASGEAELVVTCLNVSEKEVECFKDRLKYVRKKVEETEKTAEKTEKETENVDLGF